MWNLYLASLKIAVSMCSPDNMKFMKCDKMRKYSRAVNTFKKLLKLILFCFTTVYLWQQNIFFCFSCLFPVLWLALCLLLWNMLGLHLGPLGTLSPVSGCQLLWFTLKQAVACWITAHWAVMKTSICCNAFMWRNQIWFIRFSCAAYAVNQNVSSRMCDCVASSPVTPCLCSLLSLRGSLSRNQSLRCCSDLAA